MGHLQVRKNISNNDNEDICHSLCPLDTTLGHPSYSSIYRGRKEEWDCKSFRSKYGMMKVRMTLIRNSDGSCNVKKHPIMDMSDLPRIRGRTSTINLPYSHEMLYNIQRLDKTTWCRVANAIDFFKDPK